jgi:hypothetical protein
VEQVEELLQNEQTVVNVGKASVTVGAKPGSQRANG